MLKTAGERAVAGIAVVLGLGLLPVLPAGVPVLVAATAAPVVLWAEGRRRGAAGARVARRKGGGRPEDGQDDGGPDPQGEDGLRGDRQGDAR